MSQPLFDAMHEVEARVKEASHILLCLDYDGVLAEIAPVPQEAQISPQMERALLSLANHEKITLAVISGRARGDLHDRLPIPDVIYAGNHGLEISGPGFLFVEPTAASHVGELQQMADQLRSKLSSIEGALVEFKGLTIAVHYRQVPSEHTEEVRRILHATLASSAHPFVLTPGDKVYEVRPRAYWNKGSAVDWIMKNLDKPGLLPIYVGDDTTDEDAFSFVSEGITVKVGACKETGAKFFVDGPADVRRFLDLLDELVRREEFQTETSASDNVGPMLFI